jgi:DNA-binding transcriptional regulator YdaS (Cro superfamily)
MGCANWASLMLAAKLTAACAAPFSLKYFNSGWFKELLPDVASCEERIETLMAKSDIRFSERAYTKVVVPDLNFIPAALKRALETGDAPDSISVVCSVELEREATHVEHVGKESLIARIWGVSPNSYPCLNGHNYDRAVSPEYFRVIETGRAHYDHVLASMVRPNGELHWLAYHRVILPDFKEVRKRVRIVSELAPVDIQLL